MKFSIVIPVWDRTDILRQCLASALSQTVEEYEVIVVTDGSPSTTLAVIDEFSAHRKLRVYRYSTQSGTACRGRNRGIVEARGEYIVFLDSDDVALPNRLYEMERLLGTQAGDAFILSGRSQYIGGGERQVAGIVLNESCSSRQLVSYERLRAGNSLVMSAVAIHRDSLLRFGGFRPDLKYREDHELYLRLIYNGVKVLQTDALVTLYRLHAKNAELDLQRYDSDLKVQIDSLHKLPFGNWGLDSPPEPYVRTRFDFLKHSLSSRLKPHMKIEMPVPWLSHAAVGDAHRTYIVNLFCVLSEYGFEVSLSYLGFGHDFDARSDCDSVLIAHHSVGKSKNVWRVKEGPIPYYFSFDAWGYSGWSEFSQKKDVLSCARRMDKLLVKALVGKARGETFDLNISKYPQPLESRFSFPSKFVFLPLQILGDTVLSLSHVDYVGAVRVAGEFARKCETYLVIKRHPYCESPIIETLLEEMVESNPFVLRTIDSVHRCIERCEAVLCCNSGVGFEALLHGKPVFTFGEADYSAATEQIFRFEDIEKAFHGDLTIDDADRECFVAYFLSEYCFDVRDRGQIRDKFVNRTAIFLE